jgi:hypothetical protein
MDDAPRGKYALFVVIMFNIGLKVLHFCSKNRSGWCLLFTPKLKNVYSANSS